eukprot:gene53079-21726_t
MARAPSSPNVHRSPSFAQQRPASLMQLTRVASLRHLDDSSPRNGARGVPPSPRFCGLGAAADDVTLRRQIEEKRREERIKGPAKGAELGSTVPKEITDTQGRTWYRANKALGKGAVRLSGGAGFSVCLGMCADGTLVALKSPAPAMTEGAIAVDELLREVGLMESLSHDNVVGAELHSFAKEGHELGVTGTPQYGDGSGALEGAACRGAGCKASDVWG